MALCRGLKTLGIEAYCVYTDEVPKTLAFLVKDTPMVALLKDLGKTDDCVAVTVDCGDAIRVGESLVERIPEMVLSVDHHLSNERFGKYNVIDEHAVSTTEILSQVFWDNEVAIDDVTAQALYVGIATDTGQFKYPKTSKRVLSLCAKLVELGANPGEASYHLYENEPMERVLLLREFLASLRFELGGKLCVGFITKAMLEKTSANREHIGGFVNYTRSIKGVVIGALIDELEGEGKVKVSLRVE